MTPEEVHRLIVEAAEGSRELSADELRLVLEHVARAGFDPDAHERVRGRLAGVEWAGRVLRGRDVLPPAEFKFVWHVVHRQEWPEGTRIEDYAASIREIVLDPISRILVSRFEGIWQLGIVRHTGGLRGPNGSDWVLVEYRLVTGHWTTAFQPRLPPEQELQSPRRESVRWLRT